MPVSTHPSLLYVCSCLSNRVAFLAITCAEQTGVPDASYTSEMAVDLDDIKRRVSKKATFEDAVADLQKLLEDQLSHVSQDAVFDLMKRIMVLLKTRFTSPAFWRAGRGLYETAKVSTCLALG